MMRKSFISSAAETTAAAHDDWMDLDNIVRVEISSEDVDYPIEDALGKARETGPQVIRLHFDTAQEIRRIQLHFVEQAAERSQEFAVYAASGAELREVVRQQWSFSPGGSTEEIEDYTVDLHGVTLLELRVDPDRSHDPKASRSYASLQSLKLA
jgi:hypothetical protein